MISSTFAMEDVSSLNAFITPWILIGVAFIMHARLKVITFKLHLK